MIRLVDEVGNLYLFFLRYTALRSTNFYHRFVIPFMEAISISVRKHAVFFYSNKRPDHQLNTISLRIRKSIDHLVRIIMNSQPVIYYTNSLKVGFIFYYGYITPVSLTCEINLSNQPSLYHLEFDNIEN